MKEQTIRELWEFMDECSDVEHLVAQAMIAHDARWAEALMEEIHAQLRLDEIIKEEP